MSETIAMPPLGSTETKQIPTVYFIDDSATMREVIKIAFRRENIHVITCADAASALNQFEQHPPDIVITDVIMPDQDGYSVCSQIKQNPQFGKTPVILMSGVVNKSVADRAVAVQADELVRKPFQPQELIGRVRNLLNASKPVEPLHLDQPVPSAALDSLFAPPPAAPRPAAVPITPAPPAPIAVPPALYAESRPTESFGHALSPKPSCNKTTLRPHKHRHQVRRPLIGLRPPLPTFTNCVQKFRTWSCSSRSCRRNCKSSGSTIKPSNFTSAP